MAVFIAIQFIIIPLKGADNLYIFKQIAPDNELAQAWITSVSQDFLGFIWIGTSDGLYRYDGMRFKTFRSVPGDNNTLAGNNITSILEDSQKNLWIASTKGISLYDRNNDLFRHQADWPRENVSNMLEDKEGRIYFGSYDGLFVFIPSEQKIRKFNQYLTGNESYEGNQQLFLNCSNQILVSGPAGISNFNLASGNFELLTPFPPGVTESTVLAITIDYHGTIWIGTRDHGILSIDPGNTSRLRHLALPAGHFLNSGTVLSILCTSDSALWVGTENNGIVIIDLNEFYEGRVNILRITKESIESSLLNNSIYSLFQDGQDNIWIGTYGGLNLYNPVYSNFQHIKTIEGGIGLNNNNVNGFFENGDEIWIATEGGINILDMPTGRYKYLMHKPGNLNSLRSNAIYAITKGPDGSFWIGTWGGGLSKFNSRSGTMVHFLAQENTSATINSNNIFSLTTDEHGNIWIGTMGGGLDKLDCTTQKFSHFITNSANPKSLMNDWVRQVFLDSRGRLWVSTYNSLELMDRGSGTFHHFIPDEEDPGSIDDNGTIVIFEDSRNHMWFGTETGLHLFNEADSGFTIYRTANGLPSNVINAILEDDEGNLWLSTNNGITNFVKGIEIPEKPVFITYDIRDGLQGNRFNQRSALKDSKGYLYFGGKNGFNRFKPDDLKSNDSIPPVLITEFLVFNKTEILPGNKDAFIENHISMTDQISLKYRYRVFTINFIALNYLIPEKNQYRYKLEGFEDNWNDAGNRNSATYTNLDPGTYTFRVTGSNSNGVWNKKGASLLILILPPWYQTFWAYTGYFSFILILILIFRRFIVIRTQLKHELLIERVEKEKLDQVSKMKTRFFTNISHEFRTPLTLIIGPLESLLSDINIRPAISKQLNIIQKNARRLLRLINQLLDISEIEADHLKLKVSKGDIVLFIKEIASLFRWVAGQKKIDYAIESNLNSYTGYFDSDKIEKICYNLISNAFKFTPSGGKIIVTIEVPENSAAKLQGVLKVIISDSGIGIHNDEKEKIFEHFYRTEKGENLIESGSGIGLALVRGLVNTYRGSIEVASSEGHGSRFTVSLPVERPLFDEQEIHEHLEGINPPTIDIYDLEQGFAEEVLSHAKKDQSKDSAEPLPVILLVEDHAELRIHLAEKFSQLYTVFEADNGKDALLLALEHIPDLIISDIRMPVMDGIEFCSQLKQHEKTSHIPIILLTAKVSDADRLAGLGVGADAYITKPFETKLLLVTVKNLIDSRKLLKDKYSRSLLIEATEINITSLDEKFLRRAIAIVEKNIANPDYSVETFSKDIGMSRSHLHRKFIGLTGLSPSGFIRTLRMKRSAQLLTRGQLTVSEILFEVGIKSRSYFTKSFKEQFGESPTDFAAKNKNVLPDNLGFLSGNSHLPAL